MAKEFIGKRVRVQIGGEPPKDDGNAIVGQDITVHVPESELGKYDSIVGEKIEVRVGGDIDSLVQQILAAAQSTQAPRREEIVIICRQILKEKDHSKKLDRANALVSITSGVATLAQFVMQLKTLIGL